MVYLLTYVCDFDVRSRDLLVPVCWPPLSDVKQSFFPPSSLPCLLYLSTSSVIASLIRLFPPIPPLAFPFFVTLSPSLFLPCLPCLTFFSTSFVVLSSLPPVSHSFFITALVLFSSSHPLSHSFFITSLVCFLFHSTSRQTKLSEHNAKHLKAYFGAA